MNIENDKVSISKAEQLRKALEDEVNSSINEWTDIYKVVVTVCEGLPLMFRVDCISPGSTFTYHQYADSSTPSAGAGMLKQLMTKRV